MRRRFLYGSGVVLLVLLLTLIVWQVSFNRDLLPGDIGQVFLFWSLSTFVFILTLALGWILFRTGVKLYIERQKGKEGSRIRSKLFFGALALSFMPVFAMVAFSTVVLNRSIEKWFTVPAEGVRLNFIKIGQAIRNQEEEKLKLIAGQMAENHEFKAALEKGRIPAALVAEFAKKGNLAAISVRQAPYGSPLAGFGVMPQRDDPGIVVAEQMVSAGGKEIALITLASRLPLNVTAVRGAIDGYVRRIEEVNKNRDDLRRFYILLLALIALFTLFVATWIALFIARQISVPIEALLEAADRVGEGNLSYRVNVSAIDELGVLVRAFNEMTRELEANSKELDARRRFTEAILESIPTGVISLQADGKILRVNRALKNLFSEEQAAHARRLEDLFSREDTAEIKYMMKRARRTGAASREMELKTERQTRHLSITVSALEEKLTSGFVIVLEDLSDLLRAQKAAAWHEVARRVAHEIKNPLTPIALSAERIGRQIDRLGAPPDVQRIFRECTSTISSEVESVKTLVDEFSQFARFPAAQPVRGDLNEVVETALSVFAGRLEGIDIQVDLAGGLPAVNIDRDQFKRVVVNLVDNAAEAMQDSLVKRLYIITRMGAADTVELVIADTGCGVSPEEKEKLFLPYFSTKGRGTGLGLAIVNHIVAEHGARVRVEDNLPAGARLTVEIPAIVELAEESLPAPAAARL
jgi:two-component system, NtrC family, nitrogen regulation sensor histidine kinase NtrY